MYVQYIYLYVWLSFWDIQVRDYIPERSRIDRLLGCIGSFFKRISLM